MQPDDADLLLDGRPVHNPYDADLPASDALRRIEARSAGYRSEVHEVVLNEPQRVHIRLTRGAGVVTVSARPAAQRASALVVAAPVAPPSTPAPAAPRAGSAERAGVPSAPVAPPRPTEEPRPSAAPVQLAVPPPAQGLRHIEL